jgi:hypothetical protein
MSPLATLMEFGSPTHCTVIVCELLEGWCFKNREGRGWSPRKGVESEGRGGVPEQGWSPGTGEGSGWIP